MYKEIPEKYLPTSYEGTTAIYPDGTYAHRNVSTFFTITTETPGQQFSYTVVPTDLTSESPRSSLGGFRYVRNIVAKVGLDNYLDHPTVPASAGFQYGMTLGIRRVDSTKVADRDNLVTYVDRGRATAVFVPTDSYWYAIDEDEITLVYPGVVKLYSGEGIMLTIQCSTWVGSKFAAEVSLNAMYDIKNA